MRRVPTAFSLLLLALAAFAAGCSDKTDTPTTPTTVTTTTETFSGTVDQLGTAGHSFVVSTTGTVTISLTSLGPLSTMSMGLGIATWNGTACGTAVSKNDDSRSGKTALTGTAVAGNYCVTVYDSGNVPAGTTVSYTVDVKHP